jgi:hypothetical protein
MLISLSFNERAGLLVLIVRKMMYGKYVCCRCNKSNNLQWKGLIIQRFANDEIEANIIDCWKCEKYGSPNYLSRY